LTIKTGRGNRRMLPLHIRWTQIEYTERIIPLLANDFRIVVPDLPGYLNDRTIEVTKD